VNAGQTSRETVMALLRFDDFGQRFAVERMDGG
jgi:hypothetical protein